ncbi:DUF6903 family protein [Muricomes intestini]|uniref:DUF6903 family protein n=1 Tax=Muricomes intestini TaxID=1796634 RepID=UPI000E7D2F48|nr:hypothetical protein [Muricomes intestini]HAX50411.1 hypothetical protein [Lachnospiraceae bacterium]
MSESIKAKLNVLINLVVFLVCFALVIYGRQTIGYKYLGIQLIGLAGILIQIWNYNRKFN